MSATADDLALLDRLTDAEADNHRAMARAGEIDPYAVPTLGTTLDSWRQMPDVVRSRLADDVDAVEPTLVRLSAEYGADYTVNALYGLSD